MGTEDKCRCGGTCNICVCEDGRVALVQEGCDLEMTEIQSKEMPRPGEALQDDGNISVTVKLRMRGAFWDVFMGRIALFAVKLGRLRKGGMSKRRAIRLAAAWAGLPVPKRLESERDAEIWKEACYRRWKKEHPGEEEEVWMG